MSGIQERKKLELVQDVNRPIGIGRKKCFKCGMIKEINAFYKHPKMRDGHLGKCKECNKDDVQKNYRKNRKYYAEYERNRYQQPKRRKKALEYQKIRRKNDPIMYRAMYITNNEIRMKRLIKKSCEMCGSCKSQAHHKDYSKPLNIRWLCRKHHLEVHGKLAYMF